MNKEKEENKSFKLSFIGDIKKPSIGNIYFEVFTRYSKYKNYIFVEGASDICYYSALFNHNLDTIAYIKCGGKSNVIGIYNLLHSENPIYKNLKIKHLYIVDKDYDDINKKYRPVNMDRIAVTKYHSFENYAFIDENKKIVLEECGLSEEEINHFLIQLNQKFFQKIKDYEILSVMDSDHYISFSKKNLSLDKNTKFGEDHTIIINEEFLNNIKKIKNGLNKKQRMIFDKLIEPKIRKYIYMRGHDLEFYFDNMMQTYGKDCRLNEMLSNKNLLSKLNIVLDTDININEYFDIEKV